MNPLRDKLYDLLNDFKLNKKLAALFLFCVLIPLIVTDGLILYNAIRAEQTEKQHAMANEASAVQYTLSNSIEQAATIAKSIYTKDGIEVFLNTEYEKPLDYVAAYNELLRDSIFLGPDSLQYAVYVDNDTVVNGGKFGRLDSVKNTQWYQMHEASGNDVNLFFMFDDWKKPVVEGKRKIYFLRNMDFFGENSLEKMVMVEIDYSGLVRTFTNMNYDFPVYICQDERILLSNDGHSNVRQEFEEFTEYDRIGYKQAISLYGCEMNIYILKTQASILSYIYENLLFVLILLSINIVLPWTLMRLINRSLTVRIEQLGRAFESVNEDQLVPIENVHGKDEIGTLMQNYNRMVNRTNELIQTVYKDRLREQETNIARQKAELLALHSQINPHFLFNALESIRMHSILKQEYETADMVERLAVMERQNVDWGTDSVEVKKEMEFVEAYLGLQKYRFGERLSYELELDPECERIMIPKLTITTFVENACIHGIESKTAPGWIFVRVYPYEGDMVIEVEDTGGGLEEEEMNDILDRMQNASIERLHGKGRVGIVNACLRLQMITENRAKYHIESEKGVGTMVQICVPMDALVKI